MSPAGARLTWFAPTIGINGIRVHVVGNDEEEVGRLRRRRRCGRLRRTRCRLHVVGVHRGNHVVIREAIGYRVVCVYSAGGRSDLRVQPPRRGRPLNAKLLESRLRVVVPLQEDPIAAGTSGQVRRNDGRRGHKDLRRGRSRRGIGRLQAINVHRADDVVIGDAVGQSGIGVFACHGRCTGDRSVRPAGILRTFHDEVGESVLGVVIPIEVNFGSEAIRRHEAGRDIGSRQRTEATDLVGGEVGILETRRFQRKRLVRTIGRERADSVLPGSRKLDLVGRGLTIADWRDSTQVARIAEPHLDLMQRSRFKATAADRQRNEIRSTSVVNRTEEVVVGSIPRITVERIDCRARPQERAGTGEQNAVDGQFRCVGICRAVDGFNSDPISGHVRCRGDVGGRPPRDWRSQSAQRRDRQRQARRQPLPSHHLRDLLPAVSTSQQVQTPRS